MPQSADSSRGEEKCVGSDKDHHLEWLLANYVPRRRVPGNDVLLTRLIGESCDPNLFSIFPHHLG